MEKEFKLFGPTDLRFKGSGARDVLQNFFLPFNRKEWGVSGCIIVFFKYGGYEASVCLGHYQGDEVAVFIEGRDDKESKFWQYCANTFPGEAAHLFYTDDEIAFPVQSTMTAEVAFKVVLEFVEDPFSLPTSVSWTNSEEVNWPYQIADFALEIVFYLLPKLRFGWGVWLFHSPCSYHFVEKVAFRNLVARMIFGETDGKIPIKIQIVS